MSTLEFITAKINMVSTFIVAVTGLLIAVGTLVKPLRNWIVEQFTNKKAFEAEMNLVKEALQATLRNQLTEVYYRSIDRGFIYENDRENFEKLNVAYEKLGGNSYIHTIHKLISVMPNETTVKQVKPKTGSRKRAPRK
jgi:hypothetical protein